MFCVHLHNDLFSLFSSDAVLATVFFLTETVNWYQPFSNNTQMFELYTGAHKFCNSIVNCTIFPDQSASICNLNICSNSLLE